MWKAQEDVFTFEPKPVEEDFKLNKCNFLCKIATMFDPLGFIAPYVMRGKIILRKVWVAGYDWDDAVVGDIVEQANLWFKELLSVENIRVSRCLRLESTENDQHTALHVCRRFTRSIRLCH
jgi:hypothetical protein